ncbi:hypothetical protein ACA910_012622 [Epithemia clementina (nom. ined.)]
MRENHYASSKTPPTTSARYNDHATATSASTTTTTTSIPCLDLHGKQKLAAIRAVTDFLEIHHHNRHHVRIITGTGSHSQRGPILRSAVEDLLKRRQMDFVRETAGSFLVRPGTGFVWSHQASTEEDTKLLFRDRQEQQEEQLPRCAFKLSSPSLSPRRTATERQSVIRTSRFSVPLVPPKRPSAAAALLLGPSPSEIALHDAELEQARRESLEVQRMEWQKQEQEETQLDVALRISLLLGDEEREKEEEEYEAAAKFSESLQWALQESQLEAAMAQEQDEEFVQQAISQSMAELENSTIRNSHERLLTEEELEESLQEALDLSMRQLEDKLERERNRSKEEDEELQKILSLSLQQAYY